jgi:peptidyl-tRNA hydrolase
MTNASAIRDLLSMLHEEWLDEGRKKVIKVMLEDMIDRMEDNLSMDDMR